MAAKSIPFTRKEFLTELHDNILSFWMDKMIDVENGGFYGRINNKNTLIPTAEKGLVMNARVLWTFSSAARVLNDPMYASTAEKAYSYLISNFLDVENGGLFWSLDFKGNPLDTKKQIYGQAFAIYGLVEYFKVTKVNQVMVFALELFKLIESHSFDREKNGYLEAFDKEWNLLEDLRLSDLDANEVKTMNTHLHVLEAYTTLYEVTSNPQVKKALENLVELFFNKFLNTDNHFNLFFDEQWNLKSNEISYGHDIEAGWLIHRAALALKGPERIIRAESVAIAVTNATMLFFDKDGGLFNAGTPDSITDKEKHWWPQAEALIGLYNCFSITGEECYIEKARECWQFINSEIIDKTNGEWIWGLDDHNKPIQDKDKAGIWKAPYHNGRAMLELIERTLR